MFPQMENIQLQAANYPSPHTKESVALSILLTFQNRKITLELLPWYVCNKAPPVSDRNKTLNPKVSFTEGSAISQHSEISFEHWLLSYHFKLCTAFPGS